LDRRRVRLKGELQGVGVRSTSEFDIEFVRGKNGLRVRLRMMHSVTCRVRLRVTAGLGLELGLGLGP
jgi:hypothetical protein